jgi:mannose-1-phosphate guanylyltransferase
LPLVTNDTMLEDTVARLDGLVERSQVLILTSEALAPAIRRTMPWLAADQVLEEPRAAGTAAALAWAALEVRRRGGADATMISVHADAAIGNNARFREVLALAARTATTHDALVTVGIVPTDPNPGLGYIEPGSALDALSWKVARFLEKPDRAKAERLVAAGYLWNSGIFAWRAQTFLDELVTHTPELAAALRASASGREAFFAAVRDGVSVDVGVLERSAKVAVVRGDFGWDDVGTWGALQRVRPRDATGNTVHGAAHFVQATNNVVHSEHGHVVLYGVQDLVVVVKDGLTMVTTIAQADALKTMLDQLPSDVRNQR